jgi:hypothetical protein
MAIMQRQLPLHTARLRRADFMGQYFRLGQAGRIAAAIAIVCVVSIMYLAQTGRVATAGYRLQELEREQTRVLHESEQYEYRIARASRLDVVLSRAEAIGMRPVSHEQVRFATIEMPAVAVVATADE